jgi:hypothetical protein
MSLEDREHSTRAKPEDGKRKWWWTAEDYYIVLAQTVLISASLAGFFLAVGLPGYWILWWLKTVHWPYQTTLEWLGAWGVLSQKWVADPRDWLGVWVILAWLPAWAGSPIIGVEIERHRRHAEPGLLVVDIVA